MKDKMKDFGGVMKEQKGNGADVKCAEIKPLQTGLSERMKFKIGEYNRATASFEMNSVEDLRGKEVTPKFDLSSEMGPCNYFKSSFARSMVINSSHKSKSLECSFMNRNGCDIKESSLRTGKGNSGSNGCEDGCWIPGKENWDLRRAQPAEVRDDESTTGSLMGEQQPSLRQKTEVIEEHLRTQAYLLDRPGSSTSQRLFPTGGDRRPDDLLLRSPLTASCRSSFHRSYSSASDVDSVLLQSQVTTLQWQLRQAEASRQMYRAVLEQVVSFLQKTHKDLDILQNRLESDNDVENVSRVSRSRSVHAVDTSPTRSASQRSELSLQHKANSFAQIGGDPDCPKHGAMFREASWRRTRKQQQESEEGIPSKLSEEAFRLLRTVKSLLSTREPDLASRLSATCSSPANVADVSSASSTVSATLDSDQSDQLPQQVALRGTKETSTQAAGVSDPRRGCKGGGGGEGEGAKGSPPQLSISSADDESGFSSLNSFQEIGVPLLNSTFVHRGVREESRQRERERGLEGYPEVGLPRVEEGGCKVHRRWSSTPSESHLPKLRPPSLCTNGDVIKVLWV